MSLFGKIAGTLALSALAGCTVSAPEAAPRSWTATSDPASLASYAPIDPGRMSELTRMLASDEFQGRAPGTQGERVTVAWLSDQFEALGLEPAGENGGWTQRVPLIRTQVQTPARFTIASHGETIALESPRDIYLSSVRDAERARIAAAPMVFVGYGVSAPEREWDDFKQADLTGKVAVFLVNDPDFEAETTDPVADRFGGQAMTYYGRWTYKFEEAARRGAIAALVIHETEAAGYGWNTVEAPAGENYNIVLPAGARQPVMLQGWIQWDAAADLFRRAGLDLAAVKREARTAGFRPIDLGATFSADLPVTVERVESHNVLARLRGAERPDETIMYSVHWDAYGIGPSDAQGNRIRRGAADDALGTAGMIEIARAFAAGPQPDRSILFAAWTAEERGLLGSEYYGANPLHPVETMAANITLDTLQTVGPARDVILIGQGQSALEDYLARFAASQGRTVTPDSRPERGLFYRADHFSLAKRGVPVLLLMALGGGVDLVDGGRAAGDAWVSAFTANCYHQPCDAWSADWDLRGAAQDAALAYRIGQDLAFSSDWPQWRTGSEFREARERSADRRR
jgi:Zn-dependent M28 family amino/carboxypeptidase